MDIPEKDRLDIQMRKACIRIIHPHGFASDTKVESVISRADKLFNYILNGAKEEDISAKTHIGIDGRSFRLYWASAARENVMIVYDDEGVAGSFPATED
jgi:hypothetical protein